LGGDFASAIHDRKSSQKGGDRIFGRRRSRKANKKKRGKNLIEQKRRIKGDGPQSQDDKKSGKTKASIRFPCEKRKRIHTRRNFKTMLEE